MKIRTLLYAGVASSALLVATEASADVFVEADINKTKDITVTENITINKTIDLDVTVSILPGKAAEADGIINQTNQYNTACGNCAEKRDEIINSIGGGSGNNGIVNVNQSAGNMNNQGNAVSVAVDAVKQPPNVPPPPPGTPPDPNLGSSGFANSQAHVEQVNGAEDNEGGGNLVDTVNLLFRDALIQNSINGNQGIVNVNQSTGNMNNQANMVALAVSFVDPEQGTAGVALSEADLGQVNTFNRVFESDSDPTSTSEPLLGINKSTTIAGSINNNQGITNVNQGAGNMANQANNVSAAVVIVR
ncbi:MAG: hypothetical protein R3D05_03980 [Dongiaceae bacterium]